MLRISRLTDYGTVVMTYLASHAPQAQNAKEIAAGIRITQPTVSKLLKLLTRAGLLVASRGAKGGYSLALTPEKISLVQIISAIEGNIALTECSHHKSNCSMEPLCNTRSHWRLINKALHDTLSTISLEQMISSSPNLYPKRLDFRLGATRANDGSVQIVHDRREQVLQQRLKFKREE